MQRHPAVMRLQVALRRATNDAYTEGLEPTDIACGLAGAMASTVKGLGGNEQEIAKTFHFIGDTFGQYQTAQL